MVNKPSRTYAILISLLVLVFAGLAMAISELIRFREGFIKYIISGVVVSAGTFLVVDGGVEYATLA